MNDQDITKKFEEIYDALTELVQRKVSYENARNDYNELEKQIKITKEGMEKKNSKDYLFSIFYSVVLSSQLLFFVDSCDSNKIKSLQNENKQIKQELQITKGLVKEKVISYDINNEGHKDYIFSNGDVYIYTPEKEYYLETNLGKLEEEQKSKLDKLEFDQEKNVETLDSLLYEMQSITRKKTKLDSLYNALKK
jgi:hypothetical protein